jgi:tetratricopeptide (TPR) repeat protein
LDAIKNTEYSIKFVPYVARTYVQLSGFYFDTDQPQKAKAVLDQALSNANKDEDRGYLSLSQGYYSMVKKNYRAAEKYWSDAMIYMGSPTKPDYDYALLYRYVMLCKLGNSNAADSLINFRLKTRGINAWPEPILLFFAGSIQEKDLIKLARRNWQKCEVFFFLGKKNLINGNLAESKKYFEESVNTGVTSTYEYDMAKAELSRAFQ